MASTEYTTRLFINEQLRALEPTGGKESKEAIETKSLSEAQRVSNYLRPYINKLLEQVKFPTIISDGSTIDIGISIAGIKINKDITPLSTRNIGTAQDILNEAYNITSKQSGYLNIQYKRSHMAYWGPTLAGIAGCAGAVVALEGIHNKRRDKEMELCRTTGKPIELGLKDARIPGAVAIIAAAAVVPSVITMRHCLKNLQRLEAIISTLTVANRYINHTPQYRDTIVNWAARKLIENTAGFTKSKGWNQAILALAPRTDAAPRRTPKTSASASSSSSASTSSSSSASTSTSSSSSASASSSSSSSKTTVPGASTSRPSAPPRNLAAFKGLDEEHREQLRGSGPPR